MKNKGFNKKSLFAIILGSIVLISTIVYCIIDLKNYADSVDYYIAVYEKDSSDANLVDLCYYLSEEHDERLFNYIDDYLSIKDFKTAVRETETYPLTDKHIELVRDSMISSLFEICVLNDDIDLLTSSIKKYYPQIHNNPKFDYLAFASDGSVESTNFFVNNSEKILETFEELYASAEDPNTKFQYLLVISAYYISGPEPNIDLLKEKHEEELKQLTEQCISDENRESIHDTFMHNQISWEYLRIGKDYWGSDSEKSTGNDYGF